MKYIFGANWKCYINKEREVKKFLSLIGRIKKLKRTKIIVFPPSPYFYLFKNQENISLGAQNIFFENGGAFTGEISPVMLRDFKVSYVIIGHSERRIMFGETDELVNIKVKSALKEKLSPVICIGESYQDKKESRTFKVLEKEIVNALRGISKGSIRRNEILVAYEPIWAIGGHKSCKIRDIETASIFIKKLLFKLYGKESERIKILYGGSVNSENVSDILRDGRVDGVLVGSASANKKEFQKIVESIEGIDRK